MYTFVYVYVYVCVHESVGVDVYVEVYSCMCICMYMCVCRCTHVYMYITYVQMYVRTYVCKHIHMMNNMQRKTPRKPSMPSPIIASPRASYPNQLIIRTLRTEYEKQTLSMKRKEYDMEDLATSLNTSQALSNQRIVSPRSGRLPLLPEVNTTIDNEDSLLTYNNYNKR